ncbi:L,D-transpeptidase [Prosthecobacter sp.]|uniref:L,D-transpeptidase n=1 Tax=Prosthecobacter sp. TaxID=1965333 RepID=UPI0037831C15
MSFVQGRARLLVMVLCLLCAAWPGQAKLHAEAPLEAVTFALEPGVIYVPLNEAAAQLHWKAQRDEAGRCILLHDVAVPAGALRHFVDGTELIRTSDLELAGARASLRVEDGRMTFGWGFHRFSLMVSPKRVEVSLAKQELRAWQGDRLVLRTHISSGRNNRTPAGNFSAGPFRARMHYSKLFNNAPMPWSVQIYGNVFIHGFDSVPNYPASHGCIRVPLDGGNPAKFFYEWVDNGSPVNVVRE